MLKLIKIFSLIILFFGVQGCSKKYSIPKDTMYPRQYNNRIDSVAGIEAREALDSLSFYLRGYGVLFQNISKNGYTNCPVYDLFVHNDEVILHGHSGNDWIGKISHVNFTKGRKGKYDYVLSFYMQGKEKFHQNHVSIKVRLFIRKNSDIVYGIISRAHKYTINMYGRIEPLVEDPSRYRPSYFRQNIDLGKRKMD